MARPLSAPAAPVASAAPTGHTKVAGVIGHPVAHSLSPALHNAAFQHLGLDWVYVAFDVAAANGEAAIAASAKLGIAGLSVTMPHKQAAFAVCTKRTAVAQALAAVNCVANQDGELVGHNTDGDGLVAALTQLQGLALSGLSAAVVGAGGAGRAAALALCAAGAKVVIVNRSRSKAESAAAMVNEFAGRIGTAPGRCAVADSGDSAAAAIASSQLVINATPLGMSQSDPLPIAVELLTDSHVLVDLIYDPAETPLLAAAKSRGATVANGVGMLLYQAAQQFTIWTGQPAPVEVMTQAVGLSLGSASE